MRGYDFTDQIRRTLGRAREEAAALNHEYVSADHMLLALLRETDGVAVEVLRGFSVDVETTREVILGALKKGRDAHPTGPELPYTSRGKKTLELAMLQAHEWDHSYIGAEHLLIGMLRENGSIGAMALKDAGVTLDGAVKHTLSILGEQR